MNDSTFKVNSSFVSERINKIRLIDNDNCLEPDLFVTGATKVLKLWKLVRNEFSDDIESDYTPKAVSTLPVRGDVTGLEVIDHNNVVVSSGSGVSFVWINRDLERNNLRENFRFNNLHKFKSGEEALCTGLSTFEDSIATIGDDGKLIVSSFNNQRIIVELEDVDSITQTAIDFISYKELLTGNRLGIMKSFDLRSGLREPSATFPISCEDEKKSNGVTYITHHPTQQHIVLAGSEEGSITVYDIRQPSFPASYLCAHDSAITELKFHPTQPDKLFSTAANGELWKWTQNMAQKIPQEYENKSPLENITPWLNGERARKNVQISIVLGGLRKAITSVDCSKQSRIVCACNNEAVYVIDHVF